MRQHYPGRRTLLSLLAFSSLIPAFAGNIPQYTVAKGDASAKYAEFTDGTAIPCPWTAGIYALLPDGKTTPNVTTAQGFPIGFDFRFDCQPIHSLQHRRHLSRKGCGHIRQRLLLHLNVSRQAWTEGRTDLL